MQDKGMTPQALKNRPTLTGHLQWYYACYRELDRDRDSDKGVPMPLTTGTIHEYFEAFKLGRYHAFSTFFHKIRTIDTLWLNAYFEKKKKEAPPTPQKHATLPPKRGGKR